MNRNIIPIQGVTREEQAKAEMDRITRETAAPIMDSGAELDTLEQLTKSTPGVTYTATVGSALAHPSVELNVNGEPKIRVHSIAEAICFVLGVKAAQGVGVAPMG